MARGEVSRLGGGGFGNWQVGCADCHASATSLLKDQAKAEREFIGKGWSQKEDQSWICSRCTIKRKAAAKRGAAEGK